MKNYEPFDEEEDDNYEPRELDYEDYLDTSEMQESQAYWQTLK